MLTALHTTTPALELEAQSRRSAETRMSKIARRQCRRMMDHGLMPSVQFYGDYTHIRAAGRVLRVDMDGAIIPAGSANDPGWRSNACRLHALDLKMAARFRRRRNVIGAWNSLRMCMLDRQDCPKIPG